jgi:hypothetical protein
MVIKTRAPKTVDNILADLSSIFKYAIANNFISPDQNPMPYITIGKKGLEEEIKILKEKNIEWSEKDILDTMKFVNFNPEFAPKQLYHYHKINNTQLTANEVALLIIQIMRKLEQEKTK